jgi:hypothetical protein
LWSRFRKGFENLLNRRQDCIRWDWQSYWTSDTEGVKERAQFGAFAQFGGSISNPCQNRPPQIRTSIHQVSRTSCTTLRHRRPMAPCLQREFLCPNGGSSDKWTHPTYSHIRPLCLHARLDRKGALCASSQLGKRPRYCGYSSVFANSWLSGLCMSEQKPQEEIPGAIPGAIPKALARQ